MSRRPSPQQRSHGAPYYLFGWHACLAALGNKERQVRKLLATPQTKDALMPHIKGRENLAEWVDKNVIERHLPQGAVHQGIALLVAPLEEQDLDSFLFSAPDAPLLLLDQVTDPHNVGAILRSAAAFDAAAVILTKDHAPEESPTLAKSASGALELLPIIRVTNLSQAIKDIKKAGYWVAGLDGEAKQTIPEAKLHKKTALVLGAEGKGLRRLTAENCDLLVRLPISPRMESLNVSNAAAVALYALSSQ